MSANIQMSFSQAIDFVILGIRNGNYEAAIVLLEDLKTQVEAVIERASRAEDEVARLREVPSAGETEVIMTADELARIAARHAAASPGPWRYEPRDFAPRIVRPASGFSLPAHCYGEDPDDAEFIVHAWQDVRALLDEVARLRVAVQALETGS